MYVMLRLGRRRAGVPDVVEYFVDDGGVDYNCGSPEFMGCSGE